MSFLEIQRWQATGSSPTVFAINFSNKNKVWKTFDGLQFFFYFVPLQAIYLYTPSYTVHKEMYRSFLIFSPKMWRLFEGGA